MRAGRSHFMRPFFPATNRASAVLLGVSDMAVRKAIASGRITVEDDGTIDPAKADRAWGSSSDPAQVRPVCC
jgi:hypothetical protein